MGYPPSMCWVRRLLSLYAINPPFQKTGWGHSLYPMEKDRLRTLYPSLSESELETAKHSVEQFVAFIAEMCELREARDEQESEIHSFDSKQIEP